MCLSKILIICCFITITGCATPYYIPDRPDPPIKPVTVCESGCTITPEQFKANQQADHVLDEERMKKWFPGVPCRDIYDVDGDAIGCQPIN